MWVVRAFSKSGEDLVNEILLPSEFSTQEIRQYLMVGVDDPLYDSYAITAPVAGIVNSHLSEPLDLDSFDYFLEFDAEETPEG